MIAQDNPKPATEAMAAAVPRVSIVMPTYNGSRYLGESVESCLDQTFRDLELIVVVDGRTTDDTRETLSTYCDPRLKVLTCEVPGASNALNQGFREAAGEFWTWTHDDNVYLPTALDEMVGYLQDHPRVPMVRAGSYFIDAQGRSLRKTMYLVSCFLYRREAALRTGTYRHEYMESNDIDFFMRLFHHNGYMANLYRYLHKYRLHQGSLTTKQLGKKELTTLRLHFELITQGVERGTARRLFRVCLSRAAIHRDGDTMQRVIDFADERELPFAGELRRRGAFLLTPLGWTLNRLLVFLWGRWHRYVFRLLDILHIQHPHTVIIADRNGGGRDGTP